MLVCVSVSVFVRMDRELGMYLHVLVRIIMCEPVSRAEHEPACLSASRDAAMIPHVLTKYQELGVYLRVFSRFKSLVCKCGFQHESRAQHVLARVKWASVES